MIIFANFVEALAHVAGAADDLSLVDTVARGELQFFVPGVDLELFLRVRGVKEVCCGTDWLLLLAEVFVYGN